MRINLKQRNSASDHVHAVGEWRHYTKHESIFYHYR